MSPAISKGKRQKGNKKTRSDFNFVFLNKNNKTLKQGMLHVVTITMIFFA